MSFARFNALHARVKALTEGRAEQPRWWARWLSARRVDATPTLEALDAALEKAGIRSASDAKILRRLKSQRSVLGALSQNLNERAEQAIEEVEGLVANTEASLSAARPFAADRHHRLSLAMEQLARVVKVAAIFSGEARSFIVPRAALTPETYQAPKLRVVAMLTQRGRGEVGNAVSRQRDLELAHRLVSSLGRMQADERLKVGAIKAELQSLLQSSAGVPREGSLRDQVVRLRAMAFRDPGAAYRGLRGLMINAATANDGPLVDAAGAAATAFLGDDAQLEESLARASLMSSLGISAPMARSAPDLTEQQLATLAHGLDDDRLRALTVAAGSSSFFALDELGLDEVVEADTQVARAVRRTVSYPTQQMAFDHTGSLTDLHNFVVRHPGSIVHDLASNRQLMRVYVEDEPAPKPKQVLRTAVRVYVLDASGSMMGARARLRDALLIAELNALRVRGTLGLPVDPLYFAYFSDVPTQLERVDTAHGALQVMEALFSRSHAQGPTDITAALLSAFDAIRRARGVDAHLARATVVLVTDGEDALNLELIRKARLGLEGIAIGLSFISIGDENADLKKLVLAEREGQGFYHHVSDAELALVATSFDRAPLTLLPPQAVADGEALKRLLPALEALEALAAQREGPTAEVGDSRASYYFPNQVPPTRVPASTARRVTELLEAVAEVIALVPRAERAKEAVWLLEGLLRAEEMSAEDYLKALGADHLPLRRVRRRIELLC